MTNSKKLYIYYTINFFMTICISILLLISLYYITPDNYILVSKDEIKSGYNSIVKKIIIKKNSSYQLDSDLVDYGILSFDKNLNLIFTNSFKSQNLCYKKNSFVKTKLSSSVVVSNNKDEDIEIKIKYYTKV